MGLHWLSTSTVQKNEKVNFDGRSVYFQIRDLSNMCAKER